MIPGLSTPVPHLHTQDYISPGATGAPINILSTLRASNAILPSPSGLLPSEAAQCKSTTPFSLLQPQDLARRLLPEETYRTLHEFATHGVPTDCGSPWPLNVIEAAKHAGPHVSALLPDNVNLIWDDVQYQQQAGFVKILSATELFDAGPLPAELKISRLAVVPQSNRRGRLILNLSAKVAIDAAPPQSSRRHKRPLPQEHPSVNETTLPALDQSAVMALGTALPALLLFMFDADCTWEIKWQKIDLSDGFWRMVVEAGKEFNFVYQLPPREGDTEIFYVIPSALQMGWTNSPPYFCTATEATRSLFKRLMAFTLSTGLSIPHRHEVHCIPVPATPAPTLAPFSTPVNLFMISRVFVDDFINGLAHPPAADTTAAAHELWVSRCALHAIHAIFPPPDIINHVGGRDSISEKKLLQGDATWAVCATLLGLLFHGQAGVERLLALPCAKKDKYCSLIQHALSQPQRFISFAQFQKLHGKLQHAAASMPCMKGFMTPLNRSLSQAAPMVGLGASSELRESLETFKALLEIAHLQPTHITELVPPSLPHLYGYVDAAAVGTGGVWLPCTQWLHPCVWRLAFPPDISNAVRAGTLTMGDCEAAAVFIAECMLEDLLHGNTSGLSTHLGSDNKNAVGWYSRKASRATSRAPERMLRWLALLQRWTRRGPQDVSHYPGELNRMADFASRSFEQGFPASHHDTFYEEFTHRHALPPQLGSWTLVHPKPEIVSAAFLLLRGRNDLRIHPATSIGTSGLGLPMTLANILFSLTSKVPPSIWNAATCSWPLLGPCGMVSLTTDAELRGRKSRKRFAGVHSAWLYEDLLTLANKIKDNPA